ncbi:CinA family protein [soil metagenome]
MTAPEPLAPRVIAALSGAHQTVGTAESLTGGRLCSALVDVPGASVAVRGGIVAYAGDLKTGVLGVPADVVAEHGTVAAATARAMAGRARLVLAVDWGVATTGVAGPDPSEGQPAGRAHVAVAGPHRVVDQTLDLPGDREAVRVGTVRAALLLLLDETAADDAPRHVG